MPVPTQATTFSSHPLGAAMVPTATSQAMPVNPPHTNPGNNNGNTNPMMDQMNPSLFLHSNGLTTINLNNPISQINQLISMNNDEV